MSIASLAVPPASVTVKVWVVDGQAEVGGGHLQGGGESGRERNLAEGRGIDAAENLLHGRVAGQRR